MMMKKLMAMMAAALAAGMAMAGVARIGGVEYATLAEAFAAASGATTIELLADTSGCGIVVPTGSNVTVWGTSNVIGQRLGGRDTAVCFHPQMRASRL